jgi:pimeloyl-ACP methyl ester carboxylesterase
MVATTAPTRSEETMAPPHNPAATPIFDCSALTEGLPPTSPWSCRIDITGNNYGFHHDGHRIEVVPVSGINDNWDFEIVVTEAMWAAFCDWPRGRGFTTAQAMVATAGADVVRGRHEVWARAALVIDRILDALRSAQDQPSASTRERATDTVGHSSTTHPASVPRVGSHSPVIGRYVHITVDGEPQRIFYESAGSGPPLLCLHTAGADSRQFRYLLEDSRVTDRWTVIAFDMPWHGRSEPPTDWQLRTYRLTTRRYAQTVTAVIDALDLQRPVLAGCSMGGAIALYLASTYGDKLTGVCALEGGLGNPSRFVEWTNRADVDHSRFLTSWVGGLVAPTSPAAPVAQTMWGYAQSGPGVYQGDTYFYSNDLPLHADSLGPSTCPLYVFSGEYDYSATTEMSRDAADRLGGQLIVMTGKGHFPMSEDPDGFAEDFYPVLDILHDKYES